MQAVEHALTIAEPNDLVVLFADDITGTWKRVIYFGKESGEAPLD